MFELSGEDVDTATARDQVHLHWQRRLLANLGVDLPAGATVLDFGCGAGGLVDAYESAGFRAYGCDITLKEETERLRVIPEPYRLPFPDDFFDFVGSNQVLEHVQDHDAALAEVARVLKPGAASIHLFPARYNLIEPHTLVPLATIIQTRRWLLLWATIGIRNRFQKGKPASEVADLNYQYLKTGTRYLRRAQIAQIAARHLNEVAFIEDVALTVSTGRARIVAPLISRFPALARVYSALRARVIFLRKSREAEPV